LRRARLFSTTTTLTLVLAAACSFEQSIGDDGPRDAGTHDAGAMDASHLDAGDAGEDGPPIPDADMAGTWSVSPGTLQDGCALGNADAGTTTFPVIIAQSGATITATLPDLAAIPISLLIGSNTLQGSISGNDFSLAAYGTLVTTTNGCPYTWDIFATGTVMGDFLTGQIRYVRDLNQNPSCQILACESEQAFNAVRAPDAGP
jgi:hypothetical protein